MRRQRGRFLGGGSLVVEGQTAPATALGLRVCGQLMRLTEQTSAATCLGTPALVMGHLARLARHPPEPLFEADRHDFGGGGAA